MESSPQALGPFTVFTGTLSMSHAQPPTPLGGVGEQEKPATFSPGPSRGCRKHPPPVDLAGTSVLVVLDSCSPARLLTHLHLSHTSAHAHICTPHTGLLMYMSYTHSQARLLTHVCPSHTYLLMHTSVHISHKCSYSCLIRAHRHGCSHTSCTRSSAHISVCTPHVCSHTRLANHHHSFAVVWLKCCVVS